jgi:hypothetical protein
MPPPGYHAGAFSFIRFEHFDAFLSGNTGFFRLTGGSIGRFYPIMRGPLLPDMAASGFEP